MGPLGFPLMGGASPFALYLDFQRNDFRLNSGGRTFRTSNFNDLPGASVSTPAGYTETNSGLLVLNTANRLRSTDKGLLVEESRTNKATNTNVNPSALTNVSLTPATNTLSTLTLVNDSAALAAIGLTGNAYKLDNSAGDSSAFAFISGAVGNTNNHVASAYMRGSVGITGAIGISSTSESNVTLSANYTRFTHSAVPSTSARTMYVKAFAGQVVYFILNQLEEGSFVTSPILVAGSSATRGADSVSVGGLSLPSGNFDVDVTWTNSATPAATPRVWEFHDGSEAERLFVQQNNSGVVTAFVTDNSVSTQIGSNSAALTGARDISVSVRRRGSNWQFFVGDTQVGSDTAIGLPTITTLGLGYRRTNVEWLNGYLKTFVVRNR